jgi:hypothetical protein
MINGLISLANHLDTNGYEKEAVFLDRVISLAAKNPDILSDPNDVIFDEPKSPNTQASRLALNSILNSIRTIRTRRSDHDDGAQNDGTYILGGFGMVSDAEAALDEYNYQYPKSQMSMEHEPMDDGKTKITWV